MDFETAFNEVSGLSLREYEKKLNEDFKNGWKEYNKMIPVYYPKLYTEAKTKCFEKYISCNPDNINALLDLAQLYEIGGNKEKTKQILEEAVATKPDNKMTWYRLALINQEMDDFDGAIKAFEKEISVDENPAVSYLCLAQTLLTKDLNKAITAAQKALEFDKSDYVKKETQAIYDFQSSIKKGKPYEGGLQLIRSDTIYSDNIKRGVIEKLISDYPEIKNSARNELVGVMNKLKEK